MTNVDASTPSAILASIDASDTDRQSSAETRALLERYYALARRAWEADPDIEVQHLAIGGSGRLERVAWVGGWFGKPVAVRRLFEEQALLVLAGEEVTP